MDNKTFVARLSKATGSDPKVTAQIISAFATVIRDCAADLDSVAIPGFGSFVAMKRQEHVVFDAQSGKRMLMPPKISLDFVPGTKLKKGLIHE